jgi:hypothetical protein
VDPVPDPLLHRKSRSAGNWIRDFWICNQELWPLDHRAGLFWGEGVQLSRVYLKTETQFSLRNVAFWNIKRTVLLDKDRTMDNAQKHNICTYCITLLKYNLKLDSNSHTIYLEYLCKALTISAHPDDICWVADHSLLYKPKFETTLPIFPMRRSEKRRSSFHKIEYVVLVLKDVSKKNW